MSTTVTAMTAEQLLDLPDDGQRHELVRGELRSKPSGGFRHGRTAASVGAVLSTHAARRDLGVVVAAGTGFHIERAPDTVRAPDAAFVIADRLPPGEEREGYLRLAPDLVVEVLEPSDRAGDVLEKTREWLTAGATLVWSVYSAQRLVAVHTRNGVVQIGADGELDGGDVLPGLRLPVAELLA